jgi:fumarate hydratase, class II
VPALEHLAASAGAKAAEFDGIVKIGRTHLQDATPIRLGQELSGTRAGQTGGGAMRRRRSKPARIAAGRNGRRHGDQFASRTSRARRSRSSRQNGNRFRRSHNHFEAQAAKDGIVETSGLIKTIAVSLTKIANDIRWLASGPRCGIGEISIPATQPGSSIMPGKVNPVMSEMMLQVAAQVIGNDATIAWSGAMGSTFELNVMMPVMAFNLLQSIELLSRAARVFADRCVAGLQRMPSAARSLVEQSLAMCTSLAPLIGYDKAAEIAKESMKSGKTVRQVAAEKKVLGETELNKALDPHRMTEPQADMIGRRGRALARRSGRTCPAHLPAMICPIRRRRRRHSACAWRRLFRTWGSGSFRGPTLT